MNQNYVLFVGMILLLLSCSPGQHQLTRISATPSPVMQEPVRGEQSLQLGSTLWINTEFAWRDGYVYIPFSAKAGQALPLLVWLHGGGGHAKQHRYLFTIAERFGVAMLVPDSRHNTWDGIDSPFGPDVAFIDKALRHVYSMASIDRCKIAIGGLSDGGSYSLALGRVNGDVFSQIIAVAPWRLSPPDAIRGQPQILVAHGERDNVYPALHSELVLVPGLRKDGYDVTYLPFDGPHWLPEPIAEQVFAWLRAAPVTNCQANTNNDLTA